MIDLHEVSRVASCIETDSRVEVSTAWGGGSGRQRWGSVSDGYRVFSQDGEKFWRWTVGMAAQHCECMVMPLNCTFKNGESGKFYVIHILP